MRRRPEPAWRFEMPHRLPDIHVDLQDLCLPDGVTA
jgi:hypothetical protein